MNSVGDRSVEYKDLIAIFAKCSAKIQINEEFQESVNQQLGLMRWAAREIESLREQIDELHWLHRE